MNIKTLLIAIFTFFACSTAYTQTYQINGDLGLGTAPEKKLDVDGDTKLRGDAEVEGELKLKSMEGTTTDFSERLLYVDDQGNLQKTDDTSWQDFLDSFYKGDCSQSYENPKWVNETGDMILCNPDDKLGVGVLTPLVQLHVAGQTVIGNNLSIGTVEPQESRLHVQGDGMVTGNHTVEGHGEFGSLLVNGLSRFHDPLVLESTGAETMLNMHENGTSRFRIKSNGRLELSTSGTSFFLGNEGTNLRYNMRSSGSFKTFLSEDAPSAYEVLNSDGNEVFRVESDGGISAVGASSFASDVEVEGNTYLASNGSGFVEVGGNQGPVLNEIVRINNVGQGSGMVIDMNGYAPNQSPNMTGIKVRHNNGNIEGYVIENTVGYQRFRAKCDGSLMTNASQYASNILQAQYEGTPTFTLKKNGAALIELNNDNADPVSIENTAGLEVFKINSTGHVFSQKVIVELAPFPDYVFEKDYDLMSLAELRQYIKENQHLPNMPSAKSVHDNGADLGELNRLLVEKVEELTLYVLQLQEQMDELKGLQNSSK